MKRIKSYKAVYSVLCGIEDMLDNDKADISFKELGMTNSRFVATAQMLKAAGYVDGMKFAIVNGQKTVSFAGAWITAQGMDFFCNNTVMEHFEQQNQR